MNSIDEAYAVLSSARFGATTIRVCRTKDGTWHNDSILMRWSKDALTLDDGGQEVEIKKSDISTLHHDYKPQPELALL